MGDRLLAAIETRVAVIADGPELFARDPKHPRARRTRLKDRTFPFSIVYTVRADGVIFIIAIAHAKRRPGYWSRRLPKEL